MTETFGLVGLRPSCWSWARALGNQHADPNEPTPSASPSDIPGYHVRQGGKYLTKEVHDPSRDRSEAPSHAWKTALMIPWKNQKR